VAGMHISRREFGSGSNVDANFRIDECAITLGWLTRARTY
jgi:hypothetical protein